MSKYTQTTLLLIVLVASGVLLFQSAHTEQERSQDNLLSMSNQELHLPSDWQVYEDSTYNFSIAHPSDISVHPEGVNEENHIKFTYLGSPQATGHINDGFTLTVSTYPKEDTEAESLSAFVENRLSNHRRSGDVVQEPAETMLGDTPVLEYQIETLRTIDITALETAHSFITISHNITDPHDNNYDQMIALMKRSLTFSKPEITP